MAKKKKDTNGAATLPGGWAAAAEASAAKDAPRAVQTRLDIGSDVCTVYEHHDIQVAISADEAELLNAQAAEETAKALALEAEIAKLNEELIAPKKAAAKEHRKAAEQAAREGAEHKRTQPIRLKVEYHPSTATVRYLHPETGKQMKLDRAMTAKELENYSLAADPSPERVDLEPDEADEHADPES